MDFSALASRTTDFMLEVAKGNVPGHSHINKFGHNPAATAGDDIWGGGGIYPFYPTDAVAVDIVSTDAQDDSGDIGAIQVTVIGLDANWDEQQETVALNGLGVIQLSNTYTRLYRAWVHEAGTSNVNLGDITAYARATGSGVTIGDVGVFIGIGDGQTLQTIYTVPNNKTAYFVKGYTGLATDAKTAENGTFRWLMKLNDGVNGAWLTQGEIGLVNLGSGNWQYEYGIPAGPLPEKTDIRIALTTASTTFDTVGGFDLILVDN
jgi:hypothetical protein